MKPVNVPLNLTETHTKLITSKKPELTNEDAIMFQLFSLL